MISVHFQDQAFNITAIQGYAPTINAKEAEVEQFYEDLQDLLEHTHTHTQVPFIHFIIRDWNTKVESQEISGVIGKFGFGVQNEAGQRLIDFAKKMHWS